MRRLAALILPVLALAACSNPGYGPYPRDGGGGYDRYDSREDPWYDDGEPLGARIVPRAGMQEFTIELNQPAYVAVFEILPGAGVGLIYPRSQGETAFLPWGNSLVNLSRNRLSYDWYNLALNRRYGRDEPRFYFLVASRKPLRISRFQRGGDGALRSVLGLSAYSTIDYRSAMNDLVAAIVPNQPDEDWTTDVYSMWPERRSYDYYYSSYPSNYVRVDCGNGLYDVLPWELSQYACRRYYNEYGLRPRHRGEGGTTQPPPARPDTTTVVVPGRHRPEPPTGGQPGPGQGTRRPRPLTRPVDTEPSIPRTGGGEGPRVAPEQGQGPRAEPRPQTQEPRFEPQRPTQEPQPEPRRPRDEPRAEPERPRVEPKPRDVQPREVRPRDAEPREEPRHPEPVRETPRFQPREEPRPEPRREEPRPEPRRVEPVRESPRVESRPEPVRETPRYEAPRPAPPPPPPSPPPARTETPRVERTETPRVERTETPRAERSEVRARPIDPR